MRRYLEQFKQSSVVARVADATLAPTVWLASVPMRLSRKYPMPRLPLTTAAFRRAGFFPIVNHYYEPLYEMEGVDLSGTPRALPGIDFALADQLALLSRFDGSDMPEGFDEPARDDTTFSNHNPNFGPGDADLWFHMIRHFKPARIIEIGSGHSTKVATLAVAKNTADDHGYACRHRCIEPYEMPWLDRLGVEIIRERVEAVDLALFEELEANDILFIDSSHIIRPGGDVLTEYLTILPILKPGVIVHVHDIFTPRDYPARWLTHPRFWNEQYLLEAFLTHNDAWAILLAANNLGKTAPALMEAACPYFRAGRDEPGSFYMRRN